jgi:RNA polymerase sigma-70 factor (ECF subfamily)
MPLLSQDTLPVKIRQIHKIICLVQMGTELFTWSFFHKPRNQHGRSTLGTGRHRLVSQPRQTIDFAAVESDDELLLLFRSGETAAFGELVRRFQRELYAYLRRYLGHEALAEDVFQNTFLQVYQKASQFEDGRKIRPWLYAIATHQAIDALRRQNRRVTVSLDQITSSAEGEVGAWSETLAAAEAEPLAGLELSEQRQRVRSAIEALPEHLKVTIILAYYQGLKYREIADILEIPVGTVKSRLHAALAKLQEAWQSAEPAPTF